MNRSRRQTDPSARTNPQVLSLTGEQFERLRDLLAAYSGVYLDVTRQRVLETSIAQRLAATGKPLADYQQYICSLLGRDELRQLAEYVLNHETFFFRSKAHIRALCDVLLPELHASKPHGVPIRLWSAGCATGEEAYSLAIAAQETLTPSTGRPIEVWATDLSSPAIERARLGYYQGRALVHVSPDLLARYFVPSGRGHVVNDALRQSVRFETLNLLEAFPPAAQGVDIIFCQNVMIYFQLETCRALLERFYACLPEGGLLCLGFSETVWNVFDGFRVREVANGYVYYKEALTTVPRGASKAAVQQRSPSSSVANRRVAGLRVTNSPAKALDHIPVANTPVANVTSDATLLEHGRALLANGEVIQALDVLQRVSLSSTQAMQASMLTARIHADRGELARAVVALQRVLELDSLAEDAHVLLGVINGQQGDWAAAAQQFERARYLNPDVPLISFHLAESLRQLGRAEAAAREYRTTLRKLDAYPPDVLLDGVAVEWLKETCQRHIKQLSQV